MKTETPNERTSFFVNAIRTVSKTRVNLTLLKTAKHC